MAFYHGTARKFRIGEELVPPKEHGFEISEKGRKKNLDKVFFTSDVGSAKIYARRAVNSYGGIPHIYEVEVPNVDIEVINPTPGTTVYAAPRATIVGEVEFEKPMEDIFENWREYLSEEAEKLSWDEKVEKYKNTLLSRGGKEIEWNDNDNDIGSYVHGGKFWDQEVVINSGLQQHCHGNAACAWRATDGRLKIVTGHALDLGSNEWFLHSWLYDPKSDKIVEPTPLAGDKKWDAYFGFQFSDDDARHFTTYAGEGEWENKEDLYENWRDFFNKEPEPKEERIPPIPSRYLKSIRGWQWKDENWSSLRSSGWTLISWRTMRRPSEQPPWAIRSNDPSRNVGRWVSPPGDLSRDPKLFPVPYILWLEQKHKPWIEKVNRSLENGDMSLEGLKQLKNQVLQSWSTESNDKAIKKALEMALERIKKDFLELNIKYGGAKGGLSLAKVPGAEGALSRPEPSEKGAISLAEIWRKFLV